MVRSFFVSLLCVAVMTMTAMAEDSPASDFERELASMKGNEPGRELAKATVDSLSAYFMKGDSSLYALLELDLDVFANTISQVRDSLCLYLMEHPEIPVEHEDVLFTFGGASPGNQSWLPLVDQNEFYLLRKDFSKLGFGRGISAKSAPLYLAHQQEILDSVSRLPPAERRRVTLLIMQWDYLAFKSGNTSVDAREKADDVSEIQELADSVATDAGETYPETFLYSAFRKPNQIAWIGLSLFYNPVFGSDAPSDIWLGGFKTVVGLAMFGGDFEWRVGVNFGHNGDDEFSYYGYRIKGHSGFSMIDMDFIYGYPFYEGTRQRMTADVGVGWWSGNVPEDHPETQYLFYYAVGLRYDFSFRNRNVRTEATTLGILGLGIELDMNYADIVAVKADIRIALGLLW